MREHDAWKGANQMREDGRQDMQDMTEVLKSLDALRDLPGRDPAKESAGRAAFLEQAGSMRPPVSVSRKQRLKGWKPILGKERSPMTTLISALSGEGIYGGRAPGVDQQFRRGG